MTEFKIKKFIYILFIAIINIVFHKNFYISLGIVIIEVIILIYFFIKKDIFNYFINYLIFTVFCLEQAAIIGIKEFYGFISFKILGFNLSIIALIPIFIHILFNFKRAWKFKENEKELKRLFIIFTILTISAIITSFFNILINDNNIHQFSNLIILFFNRAYYFVLVELYIIVIIYIKIFYDDKFEEIGNTLLLILVASSITILISFLFGISGSYSHINTLLITLTTQTFLPFLIFISLYKDMPKKFIITILGIIGTILIIYYNPSGKAFILLLFIPFIWFHIIFKQKKFYLLIFSVFIVLILFILIIILGLSLETNSQLTSNKINEVIGLLKVWDKDWLSNMPMSPRYRVIEVINILFEYLKKPYYFLLGKGYLGTYKDYVNGFITGDLSAFSSEEYQIGIFYYTHDAVVNILLINGLTGLIAILYYLNLAFKKISSSFWLLIGVYWFIMLYAFSITLSLFGITCLVFGIYEVFKDKNK